jgi:glutathione synthase
MTIKSLSLGVVMDPITHIKIHKDSTFAMLLEAQRRGWALWYMEQPDLFLAQGAAQARMRRLDVADDPRQWYRFNGERTIPLDALDVILMRKDPPFDMEYIYTTYLLEQAERAGALVVNRPRSLRDANEKLFTAWFPQCCPTSLVTRDHRRLLDFIAEQGDAILKPLDGMGGASIFRVAAGDPNRNVIIETLTDHGGASSWPSATSRRSARATSAS